MERLVDVLVYIRKNDTGEIRVHKDQLYLYEDGSPSTFNWEHNNYSCDCNRRLFFARADGEPEDWEAACGDGAYSVNIMLDNKCIYSEFEDAYATT